MTDLEPFRLTDQRQIEIHEGLGLVGVAAQEFFLDACRILAGEPLLATRAHLVGHCLREIESATRQVLRSFSPAVFTPKKGKEKFKNKNSKHAEEILEIIDLLEIDPSEPTAKKWLQVADPESDQGLHRRAHRHNLGPSRSVDEDLLKAWEAMQAILLEVVGKMRGKYADVYARLDKLAASNDPEKAVEELWDKFPHNPAVLNYFIDRVDGPAWLTPLKEKGYFAHVYDPEQTAHGSQLVPWSQSRYLARVADSAHGEVHEILMEIPDTDNFWVQADLADAASKLPGPLAADWAKKEAEWIRSRDHIGWLLPKAYQTLAVKLADSEELDACHELTRAGELESARSKDSTPQPRGPTIQR